MDYLSTRGRAPRLDFRGVLLAGLASDGGLYLPATMPHVSREELASFTKLSYAALALKLIAPFVGDAFPETTLQRMIEEAYASFDDPKVAPLVELKPDLYQLELFHGPTLSFKDFALQLVGRMMGEALGGERAVVLGATSGDTGSAAIAGCAGQNNLDIVILYPEGRVSDVQRRQMTATGAKNVHAIAIAGTFDDCQSLVKRAFGDEALRAKRQLLAVNSINWARVMAQTVYYFYAGLQLGNKVSFCVPTGNFGNIFAGFVAKRMGLPMGKLLIATNENDILARTLANGDYKPQGVQATLSPAMDIQVSSNFERLLFELSGRDATATDALMQKVAKGGATLPAPLLTKLRSEFAAIAIDDAQTLATIRRVHVQNGRLIDPHSAVGVAAAEKLRANANGPIVTLATAHAAKFGEAVEEATGQAPKLPDRMADLYTRQEYITTLPNSPAALKEFLTRL